VDEVVRRGQELIARLKPPPGTYITGNGVHPDLFTGERRDPNRDDLDRVSREHPVLMSRHCGHTVYCNSLALKMAGIADSAPDVEGGVIEKDAAGRPTGVIRENAGTIVRKPVPPPGNAELKAALGRAMEKALSLGITGAGSYDTGGPDFDTILGLYQYMYDSGKPRVRVYMQCGVSASEKNLDAYIERGLVTGTVLVEKETEGPLLRMGPLKLFIDGTLGGQTAWMRKPYLDMGENAEYPAGYAVIDEDLFNVLVKKADAAGFQVAVHAIGDAAAGAVLSAYEQVTGPGHNPRRHGIVHCQVTMREDLERMARNTILALVQPIFLADDMHILENRVGAELASTSYAWGTMETLGIPVSYGTDAPVSPLDPLLGIEWAVRRQKPGGRGAGFYPAHCVDVYTAVDAYTSGSAVSNFSEEYLGRVKSGYLADLAFIDRDIFSIPPEEIHSARVVRTMMAGKVVWER
jgi:predicted amidohydrolase YtcJ